MSDLEGRLSHPQFVFNEKTGVLHAAKAAPKGIGERHIIQDKGHDWMTQCRCELVNSSFVLQTEAPEFTIPCKRKACHRALSDIFDME